MYDVARSRMVGDDRFTRGTEEFHATSVHYVYTSTHLGSVLIEGGFADIERYGAPDGEPYVLGASRLLPTARRTGAPPV
ncbi:MAG: hypothetical protein H0V92_12575 [Pseudonocardiales bacterium]|nr:hypothetical protein [Pseudonocardiales bacterium]